MQAPDINELERDIFCDAPVAMMMLDDSGRVAWANAALSELIGLPSSQLLGHNQASLPSPAHRVLFNDARLLHLEGPGAPDRWLRCDIRTVDRSDRSRIYFFQDVTREIALERDNTLLSQQLDNLRQSDDLTGLPNTRAMLTQLDMQVSRTRRYRNPLSVLLVGLRIDTVATPLKDAQAPAVRLVAQYLRERMRWVDQIGRWSDDRFLLVLPETTAADADAVASNLIDDSAELTLPSVFGGHDIRLSTGAASWQQGDDATALVQRAEHALAEPGATPSAAVSATPAEPAANDDPPIGQALAGQP